MLSKTYRVRFLAGVACVALATCGELAIAADFPLKSQTAYKTPEDGFRALKDAAERNNLAALRSMFGPESNDLVSSGDPVEDQNNRKKFVAAYNDKANVAHTSPNFAKLRVGDDDWEFPIPMEKMADGWRFDTANGLDELVDRRIGRNELNAIQASRAFVDAEQDYASVAHNKDRVLQYARQFLSTPGTQDGLYWPTPAGAQPSPLGDAFAQAAAAGYTIPSGGSPAGAPKGVFYGYKYQILTSQGPAAKGGAFDYIINGKMIGGFALVAYPANYRASGVMTFVVNHDGVVFQKDLGPDTDTLAPAIRQFNPDSSWTRVKN